MRGVGLAPAYALHLLKTERQQSAPPALPCRVPNHDEDPSRRRSWRSPCRPPGPGRRPFLDVEGLRAAPARSGEPGTGAVRAPRQRAEVDVHHPCYIGYGTDVTITVEDAAAFNAYSLSLPLSGEQELCRGGLRLLSDVRRGGDHRAQRAPGAEHRRGLPQAAGGDRPHGDAQGPGGDVAAADRYALALRSGDGCPGWRLRVLVAHRAAHQRGDGAQRTPTPRRFSAATGTRADQGTDPAQPNNYSEALQQGLGGRPPHYLLRAREFLQANARETLSLEDVERAAGVSRFKLFEGFRRYFGVSPMSYPEHYRLAAVREGGNPRQRRRPAASRRSPWAGASATSDASPWTTASA